MSPHPRHILGMPIIALYKSRKFASLTLTPKYIKKQTPRQREYYTNTHTFGKASTLDSYTKHKNRRTDGCGNNGCIALHSQRTWQRQKTMNTEANTRVWEIQDRNMGNCNTSWDINELPRCNFTATSHTRAVHVEWTTQRQRTIEEEIQSWKCRVRVQGGQRKSGRFMLLV